ncbi:MAG: hypothetical protein HQL72_14005 [Magnetococcales bacterium]|nr:hypothetical protein [Magnetococcales bacterium]
MKIKSTILSGLLAGLFFSSTLTAGVPVHRKGCEFPLKGVQVCWEATASLEADHAPYEELHMLPISRKLGGSEEILVDYTRQIYRQLLPGSLAERLVPEWEPVFYLEEAVMSGQEWGWPAHMWISPRRMRNSSEMSPGLVDWDVYLFSEGKLARTLRIRVESNPKQGDNRKEIMATTSAALLASAKSGLSPIALAATVAGAGTMATATPPEAGFSLEVLTELATRQILFLAQFPIQDLNPPNAPVEGRHVPIAERLSDWGDAIFSPK